ncbi:MAG: hypothetical protein GY928_28310 [Colwellia sp.]|nr:hypothetical protein [Colwellia sp.]
MAGQIYQDKNLNGNSILDADKVTVQNDAATANELVRKSQVETIADTTTQAAIVNSLSSPNATTTLDTEQLQAQLNTKQNNLSIAPDSTLYLTLVGSVLGFTNLGRGPVLKDTTSANFAAFLATATFNGDGTITVGGTVYDSGTQIFLTASTVPTETVYIYTGGNAGTADDFINDSDKYDASEVRALLSVSGVGINYDSNTGVTSLVFGTSGTDLGGQTLPHGATFTTITPSAYTSSALEKLELLINAVDQSGADGTAAVTTRLNNLSGVTGSNMGSFTGSLFVDGQNIKQLFQASETAHESATADRAAIRSEAATRSSAVDAAITSEASSRASADSTLQANITAEETSRISADSTLQSNINSEASARSSADTTLQSNIDAEEAARIAAVNQEATDRAAADTAESTARASAVSNLQSQIDVLASSNIELVGSVGTDGIFNAVEADSRNGQAFTSIAMASGEVVIFDGDVTLLGNDFKVGDMLTVKVSSITAGAMALTDFIYQKGDGTDLTRANLDNATITLDVNEKLIVTHDSIERQELGPVVKAELDDTVSLTDDGQVITGKALQIDQTDNNLSSSYGLYIKKYQTGSESLTGTCRALLVENMVNSQGSGNAAIPNYAHNTIASHYDGSCNNLSIVLSGSYNEANVTTATSAIIANGSYSVSNDAQLGINVGATMIAENAAISNISAFAFAGTDGAGADRGVVGAISNLDVATYSGTRQADPYPYNDIAVVADAKYAPAGSKALYAYGDTVFEGGSVVVPASGSDAEAVNMGELKAKQKRFKMDTTSGVSKQFASGLDLSKCLYQVIDNGQAVGVSVNLDTSTNEITLTATGGNLTDLVLLVIETVCGETLVS